MLDNIRHLIIIINCNNITYYEKIIIEDSVEYLISNIILHKLKYRIFLNFKDLNIRWSNAFHETKSYTSEQVLNFSRYYQNNF